MYSSYIMQKSQVMKNYAGLSMANLLRIITMQKKNGDKIRNATLYYPSRGINIAVINMYVQVLICNTLMIIGRIIHSHSEKLAEKNCTELTLIHK